MSDKKVILVVCFKIHNFDKFFPIAKASADHCSQHEPDTLTYDWFIDDDKVNGRLIEIYANVEAFRLHLKGKVLTDLAPQYQGAIEWISFEAFGDMPVEFQPILNALPHQHWPSPSIALQK